MIVLYLIEKNKVIWQRRLYAAHFVLVPTDQRMDVRQLASKDGEFDSVLDKGACLLTLHSRGLKLTNESVY
jgi:hypothetical protein